MPRPAPGCGAELLLRGSKGALQRREQQQCCGCMRQRGPAHMLPWLQEEWAGALMHMCQSMEGGELVNRPVRPLPGWPCWLYNPPASIAASSSDSSSSASQQTEACSARGKVGPCQSDCRFQQAAGRQGSSAARGRRGSWGAQGLPSRCAVPCTLLLGTGVAIRGPGGTHRWRAGGWAAGRRPRRVQQVAAADQGSWYSLGLQGKPRGSEDARSSGSAAMLSCCLVRALQVVRSI